jgi:hypothetical protein
MRWLRDIGWLAVLGAVIVLGVLRPERPKLADPHETRAAFEKLRAEYEEKRAQTEQKLQRELAAIRTDATQDLLRLLGSEYRRHLKAAKAPPQAAVFQDMLEQLRSARDGQQFAVQWGVDLERLPDGGAGLLLAWEQTADKAGDRCVLMADGKTVKVVPEDEFGKLPRAQASAL